MSSIGQTAVSTLVNAGADAMTNLFEYRFSLPTGIVSNADDLRIRAGGFTPPAPSITKYPVHWRTVSVERPATKINLTRNFQVAFRVDANYSVYRALQLWHQRTTVGSVGFASTDLSAVNTGIIEVVALDRTVNRVSEQANDANMSLQLGRSSMRWEFRDCWIETIALSPYTQESATAQIATVTFNYGTYLDPQAAYVGVRG